MGMDYTHHKMIGVYINGQINNLYKFLEDNEYPVTDEQKEEIDEGGQFNYDLVELLKLGDMDIVMLNSWSGHDFVIGYHLVIGVTQKAAKEEFRKYFPKITPTLQDFTEVS